MKLLACAIFFLTVSVGFGQEDKVTALQPSFAAIIVSDMEVSIQWYSEKFDMKIINQVDLPELGLKQANLGSELFKLELIELKGSIDPLKGTEGNIRVQGFFKIGFTVEDFDQWIGHLESQQAQFKGQAVADPVSRKRTILVLDPDGNRIQLFEK